MPKKGGGEQKVVQTVDPGTRRYVENEMRPLATSFSDYLTGAYGGGGGSAGGKGGGLGNLGGFFGKGGGGGAPGGYGAFAQRPDSFIAGPNAVELGAIQQAADVSQQAGALGGKGQSAYGAGLAGGAQQGLGGLDAYTQAIAGPQLAGMAPLWQQQLAQADVSAQQAATGAGAYGGARGEIARQEAIRNAGMNQQAQAGQILGQAANQGVNAQLAERQRMLGLAGLGLQGATGGMGYGLQGAQALGKGGSTLRGIQQSQLQEPIMLGQLGQQALGAGLGPYGSQQTQAMPSNKLGSGLGGAAVGSQFGPLGAGVGGAIGLLGGK